LCAQDISSFCNVQFTYDSTERLPSEMPTTPWPQISQDKHKDTCNVVPAAHITKFKIQ